MNFDEYLISKKIDGNAFKKAEPALFQEWKDEFEQMHANSFTVQKLNLINPIRRKYTLMEAPPTEVKAVPSDISPTLPAKPRMPRPVSNPKIN